MLLILKVSILSEQTGFFFLKFFVEQTVSYYDMEEILFKSSHKTYFPHTIFT